MRSWIIATLSIAALAWPAAAPAQQPVILKFSHVVAPDTPKGKGSEKFRELAEKYTAGKVKVEVYPNSTLYKDKEEFEVVDLPYILPNKAALRKVTDGPLGKRLLKLLEPKGMVGLAYWDNGFKLMSANKPLRA